jgi:hypothetical protein
MMEKCLVCNSPATDVRSTQFAGEHPYCSVHAQLEPDWGENDSTTFWRVVNPLVSVGDMMSDAHYEIGSLKECEESAARRCPWDDWRPTKDIV